jgi:predicted amidophosphoribosyltransferase
LQSVARLLFPPQCVSCGEPVENPFGLCAGCWRQTPFITGLVCDACGIPLPGDDSGRPELCDDCLSIQRPWRRGRAALLYRDNGRRLALALKRGDRLELARPAAGWMTRSAAPFLERDLLVVPVPAHWTRLFARRYNQAAVLARAVSALAGLQYVPAALIRSRRTSPQEDMTREERFANLSGAILPHPGKGKVLAGRKVLLVDDVMTSGATFASATEACHQAGAAEVNVVALARVAKEP